MNKKFTKLMAALALLVFMMPSLAGWGQTRDDLTWTHEFVSPEAVSNGSITVDGATWTISTTTGVGSPAITTGKYSQVYGLKFGSSGSNYFGSVTFSTDYFSNYNVKSVTVNILNNGNKSGTFTAEQGQQIGSETKTFGPTWTNLTANSNTGTGGSLNFTYVVQQAFYLHSITVVYEEASSVATPRFSARTGYYDENQSVTITCETEGAAIYYTTDGTTPTANSTAYNGAISINGTNFNGESTTLKAIAIKEGESSAVATATYTFVTPLATMDEIFTTSSTSGSRYVKFNNYVVSGKNTGSPSTRAYVTDGTKGFCIYNSDGHNFNAGDKINGIIQCTLTRSSGGGFAQINNITRSTAGLTVTTDGTITLTNIAIANLTGVNTGAVMSYTDLSYTSSGATLSDGEATIKAQADLMSLSGLFTDGKKYHVTGVYINYTNYSGTLTKQLCPRSTADIVLAADLSATNFSTLNSFTYAVNNGPSAYQYVGIDGTDFADNLTVTASSDYEISTSAAGTYSSSIVIEQEDGEIAETLYIRLKSGLTTGEHNGTLTLSASNLTTQTVALEGSVTNTQSYDITLNQTTGGTIAADMSFAEAGTTVTLSYSDLDDCYTFGGWTVLDGNAVPVNVTNNQFEMPASAVEVEGIFTLKTFTVNYSVNGTIVSDLTEFVNCGSSAELWNEEYVELNATIPTGYTFAGWTTNPANTTVVASYEPEDNATLYAVLAHTESGDPVTNYQKVQSNLSDWSGTYLVVYETDSKVLNSGATDIADKSAAVNVTIESNNIIDSNETTDSYSFDVSSYNGGYSFKTTNNTYMGRTTGTSGGTNPLSSNPVKNLLSYSNGNVAITTTNDNGTTTYYLRYNNNSTTVFRYYTSASQNAIQLYKKVTTAPSVTNYYTLIKDVTGNESMDNIYASYLITVKNGGVLTLTGDNNGDASNLVIEDGGQLYTENVVEATIKKNIMAYTQAANDNTNPDNEVLSNGWYLISYPLNCDYTQGGDAPTGVANLITTSTYDLYLFDPAADQYDQENGEEWVNYKAHTNYFKLITGHGYLYANAADVTLEFAGSVNYTDPENPGISLEEGYNLVGNPYAYNAYPSVSYYKMNDDHTAITADLCTDVVLPCTGIIVDNRVGSITDITFSKNQPVGGAFNGSIQMTLAQQATNRGTAATLDNAIVSFNEGSQLGKFYFGTQNANLYIPQGTGEYAIAYSEAQGEMPVSFRANENGQYTLTVNPEGVEMGYLHLIDNMTGADIDLLATPSYSFEAKTTDYESRFRLVFAANNEDGVSTGSTTFAFFSNGSWIINNEGEATLQVIDLNGRVLSSETINGSVSTNINATTGIYMMRLINGDNVKTQKVVVR